MCVILVLFIRNTRKKRRKHLKELSEVFERMNRRSPKNKVMSSENIGSSSAHQLLCARPAPDPSSITSPRYMKLTWSPMRGIACCKNICLGKRLDREAI